MLWTLAALLAVTAAGSAWAEPRRLLVGVVGLLAVCVFTLAASGAGAVLALLLLAVVGLGVFSIVGGVTMRRQPGRRRAGLAAVALGGGALGQGVVTALAWARDGAWLARIVVLGTPSMYVAFLFVAFVGYGAAYGRVVRTWARPVDVVVVLGAGLVGDRVSPVLASRLDRAREALEHSRARGRDTRVIVSGGQGPDEPVPEADAMARHLVASGVDPALVWREDRSTTTEENLRFSARAAAEHGVEDGRFAVVTNDFHAFRAATLLREVGLAGFGLGAATSPVLWASAVLREFAAVLWEHRLVHVAVAVGLTAAAVGLVLL